MIAMVSVLTIVCMQSTSSNGDLTAPSSPATSGGFVASPQMGSSSVPAAKAEKSESKGNGDDYISYVRAAYAYEPQDSSELALTPSDIVGVLQVQCLALLICRAVSDVLVR